MARRALYREVNVCVATVRIRGLDSGRYNATRRVAEPFDAGYMNAIERYWTSSSAEGDAFVVREKPKKMLSTFRAFLIGSNLLLFAAWLSPKVALDLILPVSFFLFLASGSKNYKALRVFRIQKDPVNGEVGELIIRRIDRRDAEDSQMAHVCLKSRGSADLILVHQEYIRNIDRAENFAIKLAAFIND
jgi:hypothetical protein